MISRLKRYADRNVPGVFDDVRGRIIWTLFDRFGIKISLYLQYRSDDVDVVGGKHLLAYVFDGRLREHRKGHFLPDRGVDFYHVMSGGDVWTATHLRAPFVLRYRPGDVRRIELFESRLTEDKIIDFNQWSSAEQFIRDAELRVWAITVSWG